MADLGSLLGAAGIGGAIGQAIVRLELDTAKYQAELKTAQASTVAGTNTMGAATSKFAGLAQTALLGVGVAAVAGAAMSVKAAIEANEAHLKLQNTFANNASLADSSVAAFEAQADALRDLTGVDDEAVIAGQALLGSMNRTGEEVLQLTPLIVDLAEKNGVDLQAAFKAVGKAADGNTGALARYVGQVEVGKTEAETFSNVLDVLGRSEGFAADRAKAEPWRVLGAQFEEIAETIGQALLPVLQSLSDALVDILPIIEKVVQGLEFLPFFQMIEGFGSSADALTKFENALIDTIPILGHFVDIEGSVADSLGHSAALMVEHEGIVAELSGAFRDELIPSIQDTRKEVVRFANLSQKEFKDWSKDTKESFQTAIFQLQDFTTETDITKTDVVKAFREMKQDAREFARAMEDLPEGKWVNDEFIQFISDQGPEWIVGFSKLNKEKQREMQEDWEESQTTFNRSIKGSFLDLNDTLDKLDKKDTRHKVTIEYEYVGFDPTKPGMNHSRT